jgi:uncharacterized peroxidase-related enzyme
MAHILLPENHPGIRGLMAFSPKTARYLNQLAEELLRSASTLSPGERELIATYVSYLNECHYCQSIHGAIAQYHLKWEDEQLDAFKENYRQAPISEKMKSLLAIAEKTQQSGKAVTSELIDAAKKQNATDREIHDAVLIAAAFCMFNRYVDGLATSAPSDRRIYKEMAKVRAEEGYANFDPLASLPSK